MVAIHQFLPVLRTPDATGDHTLRIRNLLREMGITSEIWCQHNDTRDRKLARSFHDFHKVSHGEETYLLYQASTGSIVADYVLGRPEPKLIDYHNMSPAKVWRRWEPHRAIELETGRRQLRRFAPVTELALADSEYNERELLEAGFEHTAVVPILLDLDDIVTGADQATLDRLRKEKDAAGGGATWLFVGQVLPHKAQHDLVKAFAVYRHVFDPKARLYMAGFLGCPPYVEAVEGYITELGLGDSVHLLGPVPNATKVAHFQCADVYVSLSEHEGFCIPALEAMAHGVPMVAYAAAAVPATVADAGVLLNDKSPAIVATAVARVLDDAALRNTLVANGRRRVADFGLDRTEPLLRSHIARFLSCE